LSNTASRDERVRLEAQLKELTSAWAEFEHQARRYRDAGERAGGINHGIDPDVRQLHKNLADNQAEQELVKIKLAALDALEGPDALAAHEDKR